MKNSPYHVGQSRHIRRHTPPAPFGALYKFDVQPRTQVHPIDIRKLPDMTKLRWSIEHPPTQTPDHPDPTIHTIHIVEEIACREYHGAQVVRCRMEDRPDLDLVAKIYDPLFYNINEGDPTWYADQDYSREAGAYEALQKAELVRDSVPQYHGSWTTDIPVPELEITRPVRMILIEYVRGQSMYELMKSGSLKDRLDPSQRLVALASAIEIKSKLEFCGVTHNDFAARNVMIVDREAENPSVVLIDLNNSVILQHPNARYESVQQARPINPIYDYWDGGLGEFYYWLPQPHRDDKKALRGWMMMNWGCDESTIFGFPDEEEDDPPLDMSDATYRYAEPVEDDVE